MKRFAFNVPSLFTLLLAFTASIGAIAQTSSFEGSFSYSIRVSGKDAQAFMDNQPPKRMDLHVKEDNFIINLSGGRIPRTMLFIGDSNETYVVDAANKRAFRETYYRDTVKTVPTAVPTGKSVDIKGIACKEYLVEKPQVKEKIYYYVSDLYQVDMKLFEKHTEAKTDFLTKGLEGRIPLRKVIQTPTLVTEIDLLTVKKTTHDPENFLIPRGFKLKIRDPRK